jgi:hypothetical protein
MNTLDLWTQRFNEVVQSEIDAAGGRKPVGYRMVAMKTGLGYDYIYQIFNGKPKHKPARPGVAAMAAIERVYGQAGKVIEWGLIRAAPSHAGDPEMQSLVLKLAARMAHLTPTQRKMAAVLMEAVALDPEHTNAHAMELARLVDGAQTQESAMRA